MSEWKDAGSFLAQAEAASRPGWPSIWMNLALTLAKRSTCQRLKVGCVVVSEDNTRVLALGYNGNYRHGPNKCDDPDMPGKCGCLHAEDNALLKLNTTEPAFKVMYVTHLPCRMCAKRLVNAGIYKVVYAEDYRDASAMEVLVGSHVICEKWNKDP